MLSVLAPLVQLLRLDLLTRSGVRAETVMPAALPSLIGDPEPSNDASPAAGAWTEWSGPAEGEAIDQHVEEVIGEIDAARDMPDVMIGK